MSTLLKNIRHFLKLKLFYYSVNITCAEIIRSIYIVFINFNVCLINVNINDGNNFFVEEKINNHLNGCCV